MNGDITTVNCMAEVSPGDWNGLSGATSFYLSHEWLSFVERDTSATAKYLLLSGGSRLLAALPLYAVENETNRYYRVAPDYLIAGTRQAYVNDVLVDPSLSDTDRVSALTALLETAEKDCLAFLYLSSSGAEELRRMRPQAQPTLLAMDARISLVGDTFADYLAHLGARRSYAVRKELRRFAETGHEVAVERLSDCWYEAGPLVANVQRKYGHSDTAETCRKGLSAQADALDPFTRVFTLRVRGKLRACALFYSWRDTLYGRIVGFDYANVGGAGEYFSLYMYEPLRYAYDNGYRSLHLGRESYTAKVRRGATLRTLWGLNLPPDSSEGWRGRNASVLRDWQREYSIGQLDVPPGWVEP
ncbi:GNAT family N-acetyltransferase [Saccharothrix sp. AJ9571]|nr:GNAT family N-acetyltransferase [Saccharothrix sp. AJ9571]